MKHIFNKVLASNSTFSSVNKYQKQIIIENQLIMAHDRLQYKRHIEIPLPLSEYNLMLKK